MKKQTLKRISSKLLIASIFIAAVFGQTQAMALFFIVTDLSVDQGSGSTPNAPCPTGSCFGMEVAPSFVIWTDFGPGTDGGLVVAKNQVSGGQETQATPISDPAFATPGEVTNAWEFFSNFGTFYTPQGSTNIFNSTSCSLGSCGGKTELRSWDVAWNGVSIPLGSAGGCQSPVCLPSIVRFFDADYTITLDPTSFSGPYSLSYESVVAQGDPSGFGNVIFSLVLRGTANAIRGEIYRIVEDVFAKGIVGETIHWAPNVYTSPPTTGTFICRIGTPPTNGIATVASDCSDGTFTVDQPGTYTFTYDADGNGLGGIPGTVTVNVLPIPDCKDRNLLTSFTTPGGGQSNTINDQITTTFVGHIITKNDLTSGGKNSVKICPGTTLQYESTSTVGTARCRVNGIALPPTGNLSVGDKLICTNNPDGSDTDRFSVRKGS